ncbi:MAG: hypothetical protein ACLU8W_04290 [Clostridia bacterium]
MAALISRPLFSFAKNQEDRRLVKGAAMVGKAFRHNATKHRPLKKPLAVYRGFMPFTLNHHAMIYTN